MLRYTLTFLGTKGPWPCMLIADDAPTAAPTKLRLNTPITIASSQGLLNALQHNAVAGIALMADFVARGHLADGRLVQVLPHWQLAGGYAPRMAYALHAPGPHIPPKLRAMLDYLQSKSASASA